MIRTLIVDDEPLARKKLRTLLRREADVEIVGEAADGDDALGAIIQTRPDLVFLDVQLPGKDGFSVIKGVGVELMPHVVFVTAYDEYALRAFEVHALDYLLKPFDHKRLGRALDHVRLRLSQATAHEEFRREVRSLLQEVRPEARAPDRILVKSKGRIIILRTAEIDWVGSAGNYVELHCGPENYLVRETMAEIAGRLEKQTFVRIHRTSIVNIDRIKEIQPSFHGEYDVILKNGATLVLSRTFGEKFKKVFSNRA